MTRWLAAMTLLVASCSPATVTETTTPPTTVAPSTSTTVPIPGPVAQPVRHPATFESIYFVMTDRFENGEASNDTGGIDGGPMEHGFYPDDHGWYQGGDLIGLTRRLPYLAELGMTAIWLTPPFVNRPVQGPGEVDNSSAGYHGYWQIDWSQVDPHLGTEEDMQEFLTEAETLGINVYFDVVVNHTGDVITYAEGTSAYISKRVAPYLDADGNAFDDREVAGDPAFPDLNPDVSFPYTPTFAGPADATVKSPDWLNNPIYYHNRGNSTFVDENSLYGDFFGLDDLFTEHPDVVGGLIDLITDIMSRYDIAGFRVDTVKHVNDGFWERWTRAVLAAAGDDFFVFGEVFSSDAIFNSHYTTNLGFPSVLDFVLNDGLEQYVARDLSADVMVQAFNRDDWYTDADSNASMLVKFFGNHDTGRMGRVISAASSGGRSEVLTEKMLLGFDLLFLTRGIPVVYYGDEQGFAGDGGDRAARQTMFPATAVQYLDQPTIGSEATVSADNFDPSHPFYVRIAELNRLRAQHQALVTGAQIVGEPLGSIFSFSRIDRDERIEYLIVANNGPLGVPATVGALSADTQFEYLHGGEGTVTSGGDGALTVDVPARSAILLRATTPLLVPAEPPSVRIVRPDPNLEIPTARYRIEAEVGDRRYAEVTFSMSVEGGEPVILGVDDAPPYRLYWNNQAIPAEASVELTVVVTDGSGRYAADSRTVTLGPR